MLRHGPRRVSTADVVNMRSGVVHRSGDGGCRRRAIVRLETARKRSAISASRAKWARAAWIWRISPSGGSCSEPGGGDSRADRRDFSAREPSMNQAWLKKSGWWSRWFSGADHLAVRRFRPHRRNADRNGGVVSAVRTLAAEIQPDRYLGGGWFPGGAGTDAAVRPGVLLDDLSAGTLRDIVIRVADQLRKPARSNFATSGRTMSFVMGAGAGGWPVPER